MPFEKVGTASAEGESSVEKAREYVSALTERKGGLETWTDYKVQAILRAIETGAASYDDLGLESSEALENLRRENIIAANADMIRRLRDSEERKAVLSEHHYDYMPRYIEHLKRYVEQGWGTWEDLGIQESELDEFRREVQFASAKYAADRLMGSPGAWVEGQSRLLLDVVKRSVEDDVATWENLGLKEEELPGIVRRFELDRVIRFVRVIQEVLAKKEDSTVSRMWNADYLRHFKDEVLTGIRNHDFTWEELGTDRITFLAAFSVANAFLSDREAGS